MYVASGNGVAEFSIGGACIQGFGTTKGKGLGQLTGPEGVATDSAGHVFVSDTGNSRVERFSEAGTEPKVIESKGTGLGQLEEPAGLAVDSHGNLFVVDRHNGRVEEYNVEGMPIRQFGALEHPFGLTIDSHNNILVTEANNHIQVFNDEGSHLATFGTSGNGPGEFEFGSPNGLVALSSGQILITDSNGYSIERWLSPASTTGNAAAHDTRTIYYTAAMNTETKACGEHPEYAGLACEIKPVSQPGVSGLPALPEVKDNAYNVYDAPEEVIETSGSKERKKTTTYDAAGRPKVSAVTSSVGTALPPVSDEYNVETGALTKQTAGGKSVSTTYNSLLQTTGYTDATENHASYEYDIDGRVTKANDGKGTQAFTYDSTTGFPTQLTDSSAEGMKFTANYDAEGHMLSETYPDELTAQYTYNAAGEPTHLEYKKTSHCGETCTWFNDQIEPGPHGEWAVDKSTLGNKTYTYDAAGRLARVEEGNLKTCNIREYAYDEDGNRTHFTKYASVNTCTQENAVTEEHSYDTADRLTDSGTSYSEFGNITGLAASDAGGTSLSSAYYTDDQVQNQTQGEQTIGYNLDPVDRILETISTGR